MPDNRASDLRQPLQLFQGNLAALMIINRAFEIALIIQQKHRCGMVDIISCIGDVIFPQKIPHARASA